MHHNAQTKNRPTKISRTFDQPEVLVGHSLGAGVCQLLAVLLKSGAGGGSDTWSLPEAHSLQGIAGRVGFLRLMKG